MKMQLLFVVLLFSIFSLTSCSTTRPAYNDARSFMTVSDENTSSQKEFLYGFMNDKDPIKSPTESQIVIWRTPDPLAANLILHGIQGYTHFRGIHLHQLQEAGSGLFTLSPDGVPTKLPVEAVDYVAIQESVRLGELKQLLQLLKRENLYDRLARHEA